MRTLLRLATSVGARAPECVAVAAVVMMMLHTVANAALRTAAGHPLTGTNDYVGYWYLPIAACVGFVCAQRRGEHIEARLVFDRMPRPNRVEIQVAGQLLTVTMCLGFVYFGIAEAVRNFDIGLTGGVMGVVIWPVTFVVPAAFLLMAAGVVAQLVSCVRGYVRP